MSGQAKLEGAFQTLRVAWDRLRPTWNDDRAREFHERVLVPLAPSVRSTLNAMQHADELVNTARRECE